MKNLLKQNKKQLLVLLIVLIVQCFFVVQKEGYHMDELLSFELGNAEYNPWIVPTQPEGRLAKFIHEEIDGETFGETVGNLVDTVTDVLENGGNSKLLTYKADVYEEPVWISRETFQDYIYVDNSDDFNYLSVYFNVKDDNHPPLHFMLLHTVSSLFKGQAEGFMGCVINIIAIMICAVTMMKLGKMLQEKQIAPFQERGEAFGLICGLLYGVSSGGIATLLLIRMYGVVTCLCVLLFYITLKKWLESGFEKRNIPLIFVTVLGFWTQYFFLFYCIGLALVTGILLLAEKRTKELFCYIRANVIAAVIGVGLWPFAISHVLSSGRGVEALDNLTSGLAGYGQRIVSFGEMILERCFGNVAAGLILGLGVCILLVVFLVKNKESQIRKFVLLWLVPPLLYFGLAAKLSPFEVDRYIMPVFPFVMMLIGFAVLYLGMLIPKRGNYVAGVLVLVLAVVNVACYDGEYLYKGYDIQLSKAKEYRDTPCVCLYEGYGFYDNLKEFAEYEETLLVTPSELLGRKDASDIEALSEVVFLVKQTVAPEDFEEVLKQYDFQVKTILVRESVHGDQLYYCEKIN